jgi:glycosyltransferase involved in cell wall biosynthesis
MTPDLDHDRRGGRVEHDQGAEPDARVTQEDGGERDGQGQDGEQQERHRPSWEHAADHRSGAILTRAVDVILPVHNERARIEHSLELVTAFAATHPDHHFAFVDDGSTDGTPLSIGARLAAARLPNVELLAYRPRRGKGHAIRVGVEHARAALVCFTDGDLPYSLDHLGPLVAALGAHDVVIGCRSRRDPSERTTRRPRWVMGRCFNRLARLALGLPHRDTQAGLKGFRREVARALFARQRVPGFGFDVEVLYLARRLGYRVGEIPARVSPTHSYAGSQVDLVRDSLRMCRDLVTIRWRGALGGYE